MSKVVIARKIPIRTVNKANNTQTETPTTPNNDLVPSSSNTTTNNPTPTSSNSPSTTNNNNSQSSSSSSSNNPSQSSSNSPVQKQQQSSNNNLDIDNNIEDEEDVYNPKINYEDIDKQSLKFRKFSKAFITSKKKEQVRFYLSKVEQIILQRDSKCSIVPLSMCILYHRQNGGEYALCIFKDKKMIDLCPLTIEKTEISIVLNPSQNNNSKQRSILQIISENLQGMNVEYYLQFESEVQLLSVYSALDKSLLYNGLDIKESVPTFNSLLITYSSRQMKDEVTSPRATVKFKWCEKYVEQYSSGSANVVTESLRLKSSEKKQIKSFRKTEDNNDSSDSGSGRGARLSQTENNSYSPVDETRRKYLEDNDDSLGSRHYIPSGDENTDSDGGGRRRNREVIAKSSPVQSSPISDRKLSEEDRYRPSPTTINESSDGDSSPTPKIPPTQQEQPTNSTQDNSGTTQGKKVIKRVIKRVPAKNTTE